MTANVLGEQPLTSIAYASSLALAARIFRNWPSYTLIWSSKPFVLKTRLIS